MAYLRTFIRGDMQKKLEKLRDNGKITPFIYKQASVRIDNLPNYLQEVMITEAEAMSSIGVSSEDDFKIFACIVMHVPKIARDMSAILLDNTNIAKMSQIIFNNKLDYPIDTIFNFYKATENALNCLSIPMKKIAYPQGQGAQLIQNPYDVNKWMRTMREIYALKHKGLSDSAAFNKATKDWDDKMEKRDFGNCRRLYEEGGHLNITDEGYLENLMEVALYQKELTQERDKIINELDDRF